MNLRKIQIELFKSVQAGDIQFANTILRGIQDRGEFRQRLNNEQYSRPDIVQIFQSKHVVRIVEEYFEFGI